MDKLYFRQSDDETESGPLTLAELQQLAESGQLQPQDLLRPEHSTISVAACRIRNLFADQTQESPVAAVTGASAWEQHISQLTSQPGLTRDPSSAPARSAWPWHDHVGWEVVLGIAIVAAGAAYMVWGTPEHIRFPPSQRRPLVNVSATGHYFFGTGPWTMLEFVFLWGDAVLLIAGLLFGRRFFNSRRS